ARAKLGPLRLPPGSGRSDGRRFALNVFASWRQSPQSDHRAYRGEGMVTDSNHQEGSPSYLSLLPKRKRGRETPQVPLWKKGDHKVASVGTEGARSNGGRQLRGRIEFLHSRRAEEAYATW